MKLVLSSITNINSSRDRLDEDGIAVFMFARVMVYMEYGSEAEGMLHRTRVLLTPLGRHLPFTPKQHIKVYMLLP